jgi:hypothetical protein
LPDRNCRAFRRQEGAPERLAITVNVNAGVTI